MAEFFSIIVGMLPKDIRDSARCVDQTRPGSEFLYTLGKNFISGKVRLLSLAVGKRVLGVIRVVSLTSSSLVEVTGDGNVRYDKDNTPFVIVEDVNHLNIVEIFDDLHPADTPILQFLSAGVINDRPLSPTPGDPYFVVVLEKEPPLHYPTLLSTQNSLLSAIVYPCIYYAETGHWAWVFKVLNVQADQDIKIEYAPYQYVRGRLTKGQSTIRTDMIPN